MHSKSCCLAILASLLVSPDIWAAPTTQPDPVAHPDATITAGNVRFTVLNPRLIRMEWSPDAKFEDRASQVVINRRLPIPKFEVKKIENAIELRTDRIHLIYDPDGGEVKKNQAPTPTQPKGASGASEPSPNGRFDDHTLLVRCRTGPGATWAEITPPFTQTSNLGGTTRTLDGVNGASPLEKGLLNRSGWSVIDDSRTLLLNESTANRDENPTSWPWATPRQSLEAIDWYVFVYGQDDDSTNMPVSMRGPNFRQALADFTSIAGKIPLPPRFVFGTWWSRYWAYSDQELRELVEDFRKNDVPLDVLVVDMDWHLDGWTGYTWNPKYFPDPDGFLKWCHEKGLKVTLNLHPAEGVGKQEKAFADVCRAMDKDPATTERIPFDCADPKYVSAYFKYLHHPLEAQGIDFWWMDWQQGLETKIPGLDPLWWLNYLHWNDMEHRAKETGRRPLIFSRWGGLGNHRYQIGFSGDTFCNWPSLAFQPYFTSTAGNVGYAYWSHDIGGHQPGPVDPELYARWIQWGALSPALRTHTTKNPDAERRIWKFPTEAFHAARDAYHFRYQLIPYIYTQARKCYDTSVPLCRPLYYEWPGLEEAYNHGGEYLFGDDLLVAPVTQPADPVSGCAMVTVWLPPGKWINWFTGRRYEGPKDINLVVPLDQIPLFVRPGAIIPAAQHQLVSDEKPLDPLVLHVFGGADGTTRLYEDDGKSNSYQAGECAWTPISQKTAAGRMQVTVGPTEGHFQGMPESRACQIRFYDIPPGVSEVVVNQKAIGSKSGPSDSKAAYWWYDPTIMGISVQIPEFDVKQPTKIELDTSRLEPENIRAMDGLRGLFSILRGVSKKTDGIPVFVPPATDETNEGKWIFDVLTDVAPYDVPRQWLERWPAHIKYTIDQVKPGPILAPVLQRLTGLFTQVQVTPDKNVAGRMVASVRVAPTLPFDLLKSARGHLQIRPDPVWRTVETRGWQFRGLDEQNPFEANILLAADGDPGTGVFHAKLRVQSDDMKFDVSLKQVFLPSINAWWVIGPFDCPQAEGLARVFPPEQKVDLTAAYPGKDGKQIAWKEVRRVITPESNLADEFFMDFDDVFGGRVYDAAVYAFTYLDAPQDLDASLALGSDDGAVVWLNEKEVYRKDIGRPYSSRQERIPVSLKKGINTLLVKVSQGGGDWGLCVHVETPDGQPFPDVRAILKPQMGNQ